MGSARSTATVHACAILISLASYTLAAVHDPVVEAEQLWQAATQKRLTDDLTKRAAELLEHDDPFVAALAEWAIAVRVGLDNGGQQAVWSAADVPQWFATWSRLSQNFLLDADYARQGIVWGLHRNSEAVAGSADKIEARAVAAVRELRACGTAEEHARTTVLLDRLHSVCDRLRSAVRRNPADIATAHRLWIEARRAARPIALANSAINFDEIAFVLQHSAHSHRNITGSQYPWVHKPGGGIVVKAGFDPENDTRDILPDSLGPGHVHGVDLWWDADRVVFGYARQPDWPPKWDTVHGNDVFNLRGDQEPTHLYEIGLDGTGLRQLTDHPYWSDLEPTYCANGDIVFASDRSGRSSECGRFSADHTVINLYRIAPDGSALRHLNDNKDIDRHPHTLADGRIAYTRWEYQERHFMEVHAVWAMRPDGTMADAVFNQHMRAPYGLRDTRSVPGSSKLVAIATGHHTFAYGPVVLLDPHRGTNSPDGIEIITPHVLPQEGPMAGVRTPHGGPPTRGGLYQTPWALSDTCFLVPYSYARPPSGSSGGANATNFGLYFIDVFGHTELIHRDLIYSCSYPMPVKKRPRPPVVPDTEEGDATGAAVCLVHDVYTDLPGIRPGEAKYIRIMQRVGWPLDDKVGAMRWIPGNAWQRKFGFWAWSPVREIGTVPVHDDGSAHFRVPADVGIYFQLLDENRMELRRMRSHVTLQPGETRSCVGCHETRLSAPRVTRHPPIAASRLPDVPDPPPWGSEKLLGYEWLIQPIFDRRCVSCHGGEKPKGNLNLTATRAPDGFLQSFRSLFGLRGTLTKPGKALVSCSDRLSGAAVSKPKQFGSHRSQLVQVLLSDPEHRRHAGLRPDEWRALVTWIDANAPYYDTFYNRRPPGGAPPERDIAVSLPPFLSIHDSRVAPELNARSASPRIE